MLDYKIDSHNLKGAEQTYSKYVSFGQIQMNLD